MQFETTIKYTNEKVKIEDCKLNTLARMIMAKTIEHKQSLNPEELEAWNKKAKAIDEEYARSKNEKKLSQKAGTGKARKTKSNNTAKEAVL